MHSVSECIRLFVFMRLLFCIIFYVFHSFHCFRRSMRFFCCCSSPAFTVFSYIIGVVVGFVFYVPLQEVITYSRRNFQDPLIKKAKRVICLQETRSFHSWQQVCRLVVFSVFTLNVCIAKKYKERKKLHTCRRHIRSHLSDLSQTIAVDKHWDRQMGKCTLSSISHHYIDNIVGKTEVGSFKWLTRIPFSFFCSFQ